jgi:hypothetical protein
MIISQVPVSLVTTHGTFAVVPNGFVALQLIPLDPFSPFFSFGRGLACCLSAS